MSLMGTLAKVAIGVAVAKGMKKVMRGGGQTPQVPQGGGLGSILGQLSKGGAGAGGLGGLLGGLAGGGNSTGGSSLDGMLGSVLGNAKAGGGLGGLLDNLGGQNKGGFGERMNQSLEDFGQTKQATNQDDDTTAKVLLSVMIQAAKADGEIDDEEKAAITKHLGDISQEDMAFINQQLQTSIAPEKLAQAIPSDMQQQAYAMALLAIDLDNQAEAKFLHALASSLNLQPAQVNSIHSQMGEAALYS